MEESVKKLQEIIDGSDNIVFFGGGRSVDRRAGFRTSAVWTASTIRSMIFRRRRS